MTRLEKMTPQKRRWDGCHFPHTCLFMLNRPWVTARPWQNKIRVPFCTSVSLSHGIGWQVSWGEEHCTLYSMQVYFSPSSPPLLCSLSLPIHLSIFIFLYFFHPLLHTLFITRFVSAPSLPLLVSFSLCTSASSLSVSPYPPSPLSPPLPPSLPPPASPPPGTKVKNTERI